MAFALPLSVDFRRRTSVCLQFLCSMLLHSFLYRYRTKLEDCFEPLHSTQLGNSQYPNCCRCGLVVSSVLLRALCRSLTKFSWIWPSLQRFRHCLLLAAHLLLQASQAVLVLFTPDQTRSYLKSGRWFGRLILVCTALGRCPAEYRLNLMTSRKSEIVSMFSYIWINLVSKVLSIVRIQICFLD